MAITMNDLTINPENVAMESLLDAWQWAEPESLRPVLITAMGDVFAQGESGSVYFVDTVEGTITQVADNGADFQTMLSDKEFVIDYFFPTRVLAMRNAGKVLSAGQVYSHKQPLVLGGSDSAENIEATDVSVHVSMQGQIHNQIKDLPDGASIDDIRIE